MTRSEENTNWVPSEPQRKEQHTRIKGPELLATPSQARAREERGLGSPPEDEGSQLCSVHHGTDEGIRVTWELANDTDSQPRTWEPVQGAWGAGHRHLFLISSAVTGLGQVWETGGEEQLQRV